jgi:LuxR family maltose regulon positive regulatory protein
VVALDDVHLLQNWECLDAIATLIERLAPGSQFAIAGRADPPLPLASLRAEGRVVSVGRDDLAMDRQEAMTLLRDAGVDLSGPEIDDLLRRTEGWPVALYLAALAMKAGGAERAARSHSRGTIGSWSTICRPYCCPACSRRWCPF